MQSDLQGLEISPGELRHLCGLEPTEIFRPTILANPKGRFNFLFQELVLSLALTPIIVGLLHVFVILPFIGSSLIATLITLIVVPLVIIAARWLWLKRNSPPTLCALLDEVDRYNAVIKAIQINEQLESVGRTQISLLDSPSPTDKSDVYDELSLRKKVLEALTLTREDLVKALKAEKIIRENRNFLISNPELLATNLRTLQALQVHDQASEYGRVLHEALQIAAGVSEEMKKLQNQR